MGAAGSNSACMNGAICCSDNADRLVSKFGEKWKSPKPAGFEEWTDSIQQTRRGLPDGRTPVSKQPPAAQRHVFYVSSARNSPSSSTSSMVADPGRKLVLSPASAASKQFVSPPSTPSTQRFSEGGERSFSNPLLGPVDDILGAMKGVATMRSLDSSPPAEQPLKLGTPAENSGSRPTATAESSGKQEIIITTPAVRTDSPLLQSRAREVYETLSWESAESKKLDLVQSDKTLPPAQATATTTGSAASVTAQFYWARDGPSPSWGSPSRRSRAVSTEMRENVEKLLKLGKSDQAVKNHYTIVDEELTVEDVAEIRREWEGKQAALDAGEEQRSGWSETKARYTPPVDQGTAGASMRGLSLEREEKEMAMKRLQTLLASQT